MAYKILVSPRALKEIENAIDYYSLYSTQAPANFIAALKSIFTKLELNPNHRIRYKNVRAIKLKRFPFALYFIINEEKNIVKVLSCFHVKRNPDKRPRL